jgi:hypothetical protein
MVSLVRRAELGASLGTIGARSVTFIGVDYESLDSGEQE